MGERIVNMVCPNCKYGIKHDTLSGHTTVKSPSDYPEVYENGRAWCKICQHGCDFDDDGLCLDCLSKGKTTRLRPVGEKSVKSELSLEDIVDEIDEEEVVEPVKFKDKPIKVIKNKITKEQVLR
jgi:hypothetical protein